MSRLGLRPPSAPIRYYFYPSLISLQQDLSQTHGADLTGLTDRGTNGLCEIRTAFPVHTHEILHALLERENPKPRFFVAEACATLLNVAWGTPEILAEDDGSQFPSRSVVVDLEGNLIDHHKYLIRDAFGLLIGQYRMTSSLHPVARHLISENRVGVHLAVWMEATDVCGLPANFYELGGSFFNWLGESFGFDAVLGFYRSSQDVSDLERIFRMPLGQMQQMWLDFLEAWA